MWVSGISLLPGTQAIPGEGAAPDSVPGGLPANHLEEAVVSSKGLCPGGCERPVDIDIHLQARVILSPCNDQTEPAPGLLKKEQAQNS